MGTTTKRRILLRYLLKRLLLAIPALVGIVVITFGMIHLAPGDSAELGAGTEGIPASALEVERQRRLFFLDLPLFYNGNARGFGGRIEKLLAGLRKPDGKLSRYLQQIRECGTLCLPELANAIKKEPKLRRRLIPAFISLRRDNPSLVEGVGEVSKWAEQAAKALSPRQLGSLKNALAQGGAASDKLKIAGSAAIPVLMPLLFQDDDTQRNAAADIVSDIVRIEMRFDADTNADAVVAFWREWWWQNQRDYLRFDDDKRFWGQLTETQFAKWLKRVLTFSFGYSTRDGLAVGDKLAAAVPITLLLGGLALFFSYLLAIPLGIHAAFNRGRKWGRVNAFILFLLYSLPSFWLATLLILGFGGVGYWDWFPIFGLSSADLDPPGGWNAFIDQVHHLVLPVLCLSLGSVALIARHQGAAMTDVLQQDYIRTARAKGLSWTQVIWRHGLRNTALPMITLLGLQVPYLLGGSVIIERIFNIPGMGLLTFEAFLNRDYPIIMATTILSAGLTLVAMIVADILYALADPRLRLPGGQR
jgi:peptide/nickel transport system permease protein